MSRKAGNRKQYLRGVLDEAGKDIIGKSLGELEEMHLDFKRELHIKKKTGQIGVREKLEVVRGSPLEPQYDVHPETIEEDDFYAVTNGRYTKRELRMKDSKFGALMKEMTTGYIPPPGEVAEFTPKQQIEILRHIPWKPESLLHGKGGIEVDLDGVPIEKEEKREGRLRF